MKLICRTVQGGVADSCGDFVCTDSKYLPVDDTTTG